MIAADLAALLDFDPAADLWRDERGDILRHSHTEAKLAELRRGGAYIWASWLPKLLAGENSCEWASWFRANHDSSTWEKAADTFDLASWRIEHTALLNKTRERYENAGYTVLTEAQNEFTLHGSNGVTLSGKPDLVAVKDNSGIVIDTKTGGAKASDVSQVMIYMWALPLVDRRYKGMALSGLVAYKDRNLDVPSSAINADFKESAVGLIRRVGNRAVPSRRIPSANECRYCPITSVDCPVRAVVGGAEATTDEF